MLIISGSAESGFVKFLVPALTLSIFLIKVGISKFQSTLKKFLKKTYAT
jgi:hypothetical protein